MLFNSYAFIGLFLPIVFFGMFWIGQHSHRLAALWLAFSSLTFYAVWDARFLLLLLGSAVFNYGAGYWIGLCRNNKTDTQAKYALFAAIATNLFLLGYFKYANFFLASTNHLFGSHIPALDIILPLGISFFTFTQIAFLVDVYRGITREINFIHYLLFVTYFPHLIAGPVIHHKQMMPQFAKPETYRINPEHVAVGLTIFILGLAKKVLVADTLAGFATPIFNIARDGHVLFVEAWIGALAYTLQLYFDFSGYSDMAIGLSLMFNVRMPMNFDSPYKATSIIDFWRRWHMTLSAFLRDYLYFPLGGNRKGPMRRYVNLMVTMLLGGLWHGAGWTYILWGGLHGLYLMINRAWRELKVHLGWGEGGSLAKLTAGAITFFAVVVAWVVFRAENFAVAKEMLSGMAGMNGLSVPSGFEGRLAVLVDRIPHLHLVFQGFAPATNRATIEWFFPLAAGLALVWLFPNLHQILMKYKPVWEDTVAKPIPAPMPNSKWASFLIWTPAKKMAVVLGVVFAVSILGITGSSEFLYFQF